MAYDDSTASAIGQVRAQLERVADDHTRRMAAAWANAWDDIAVELEATLNELALQAGDGRIRRTDVIRSVRLQRAMDQIQARLTALVDASAQAAINSLADVVDYAGAMTERIIGTQLPPTERGIVSSWSRVDPAAIDAIVTRATEQITKRSFPLSDEATAVMRRELVRGLIAGANPRETAARMLRRTEGRFNGGLTRALTIARTETLDAHRAAAALSEQANADVLAGWEWVASLTGRTCPSCWAQHGTIHDLDEPGPIDHQNGRCTRVPKTKPWKDLGFDIDEPPSLLPDAEQAFLALSKAEQLEILGPGRHAAWVAGEYPMSAWSMKRETPGWRDSMVPSPVPAAFRQSASR